MILYTTIFLFEAHELKTAAPAVHRSLDAGKFCSGNTRRELYIVLNEETHVPLSAFDILLASGESPCCYTELSDSPLNCWLGCC
jgi:hypothetical protein